MTSRWAVIVLIASFLDLGIVSGGLAQSCALNQSGFGQTRQALRNCQGRNCGADTPHDCGPLDVEITPKQGTGIVGKAFQIRIDSTQMCNGQSVRNFTGRIKWEAGSTCNLPDSWGWVEHTYAAGGTYTIEIEMSCDCYDPTGASRCTSKGTSTVKINPK